MNKLNHCLIMALEILINRRCSNLIKQEDEKMPLVNKQKSLKTTRRNKKLVDQNTKERNGRLSITNRNLKKPKKSSTQFQMI